MMTSKKPNQAIVRGELLCNEAMSKHTSWRVGGPAEYYFKPADRDDLIDYLKQVDAHDNIYFIGLGSNLLVRDGGIKGLVIAPLGGLSGIQQQEEYLYVEAGVSCAKFARYCQQQHLSGVDFLAGIPGTIGGAVAMNAGAFGSETWEFVSHIDVVDNMGNVTQIKKSQLDIAYREVSLDTHQWIIAAYFKLKPHHDDVQKADIKSLLDKRNNSQPIGLPSCGSVFRNPKNDYAARLIESCGLKGHCIGGACVSEKHANFIINTGSSSAQNIEDLIHYVQQTVYQQSGIELVLEAHVIGDAS